MRKPSEPIVPVPLPHPVKDRMIRRAVLRRRKAAKNPGPPPVIHPFAGPVSKGSKVSFFDTRGRYASGEILDDDSFRVIQSNVVTPWTVLYKHPYMSWEECLKVVGGATLIKPKELLQFTRFLSDDLDSAEAEDVQNDGDDSGAAGVRRRA